MARSTLTCFQRSQWRFRSMNASPAARTISATSRGGRLIYFSSGGLSFSVSESKGLAVAVETLYREVHVNQGVFQVFMTEQDLNGAEIGAGLIEMRSKTVAQRVGMDAFLEARALGGFLTRVPDCFRIDRSILAIVAGKQPGARSAVVATPVGAQCRE